MNTTNALRIRHEQSLADALVRVSDAGCIAFGFWAASRTPKTVVDPSYFLAASIAIIVLFLIGEFVGLYRSWRGVATYREIAAALFAWGYSVAALMAIGLLTRFTDQLPRLALLVIVATVAFSFAVTRIGLRFLQRSLRARGLNTRQFAIVGVTELGIRLARNMEDAPELGLSFAGFFDDRPEARTGELPEDVGSRLGSLRELIDKAQAGQVHRIYITLPMRAEARIRSLLNKLADSTASVLYRARLLRLRVAALALDRYRRPAGRQRL